MKILIIQTAFIGDVVLATPIIEKLNHHYKDAKIDFLLRKGNENLFEFHPKLNKILVWNKKEHKLKNLRKMIGKIRSEKYDLLINLQRFGSTGLMTWLSGADMKIGFKKNPFSFCYDKRFQHEIGKGIHEVERNLALIEHLTDATMEKPRLYLSEIVKEKIKPYQTVEYITLAPASVWFTKQFPLEKWQVFLAKLTFHGNIYLLGASGDHAFCQEIIDEAGRGENLCGKLSLIESVALIRDARMNYVNDSAPMHFASAVNAPTTALFCSTIPDFGFRPLSDHSFVLETDENLPCRPCGFHGKLSCPEGHFNCSNIEINKLNQVLES